MTTEQKKLFKRADHSNLGRDWESELAAVHEFYRLSGRADIVKNPSEWIFISEKEYRAKSAKYDPRMFATTGDGRRLMRSRSDVDFSGGNGSFSICFDAKACKGNTFPLSNVEYHQIHRLRQSFRCGSVAGFMIKMSAVGRVFFVSVVIMERRYEAWQRQAGKAKPGTASLSITDLESYASEIYRNPKNGLWDWLDKLEVIIDYCRTLEKTYETN